MRIFENFNKKDKCLVCDTNKDGKSVLIGIIGTGDGKNIKAKSVHVDCLELYFDKELNIIYQKIKK